MLKYKQIWHEIKPIRWLIKFNLTMSVMDGRILAEKGKTTTLERLTSKLKG